MAQAQPEQTTVITLAIWHLRILIGYVSAFMLCELLMLAVIVGIPLQWLAKRIKQAKRNELTR